MSRAKPLSFSERLPDEDRLIIIDIFERIDTTKDGWLSLEKLSAALSFAAGKAPSAHALRQVISKMDKNLNGRIMLSEFMDYIAWKMHTSMSESYEEAMRTEQGQLVRELGSKFWELLQLFRRKKLMNDFFEGGEARQRVVKLAMIKYRPKARKTGGSVMVNKRPVNESLAVPITPHPNAVRMAKAPAPWQDGGEDEDDVEEGEEQQHKSASHAIPGADAAPPLEAEPSLMLQLPVQQQQPVRQPEVQVGSPPRDQAGLHSQAVEGEQQGNEEGAEEGEQEQHAQAQAQAQQKPRGVVRWESQSQKTPAAAPAPVVPMKTRLRLQLSVPLVDDGPEEGNHQEAGSSGSSQKEQQGAARLVGEVLSPRPEDCMTCELPSGNGTLTLHQLHEISPYQTSPAHHRTYHAAGLAHLHGSRPTSAASGPRSPRSPIWSPSSPVTQRNQAWSSTAAHASPSSSPSGRPSSPSAYRKPADFTLLSMPSALPPERGARLLGRPASATGPMSPTSPMAIRNKAAAATGARPGSGSSRGFSSSTSMPVERNGHSSSSGSTRKEYHPPEHGPTSPTLLAHTGSSHGSTAAPHVRASSLPTQLHSPGSRLRPHTAMTRASVSSSLRSTGTTSSSRRHAASCPSYMAKTPSAMAVQLDVLEAPEHDPIICKLPKWIQSKLLGDLDGQQEVVDVAEGDGHEVLQLIHSDARYAGNPGEQSQQVPGPSSAPSSGDRPSAGPGPSALVYLSAPDFRHNLGTSASPKPAATAAAASAGAEAHMQQADMGMLLSPVLEGGDGSEAGAQEGGLDLPGAAWTQDFAWADASPKGPPPVRLTKAALLMMQRSHLGPDSRSQHLAEDSRQLLAGLSQNTLSQWLQHGKPRSPKPGSARGRPVSVPSGPSGSADVPGEAQRVGAAVTTTLLGGQRRGA